MSKASPASDPLLSMDAAAWRQRIQQLTMPMRKYWPEDAAEIIEANAGFVVDDILSRPDKYQLKTLRSVKGKGYAIGADDLAAVLRHLFHAGFLEAVLMHRRELVAYGELMATRRKVIQGGDITRAKSTEKRLGRVPQAQAMFKAGSDVAEIARALKCHPSTVYRALNTTPAPRPKATRPRQKR